MDDTPCPGGEICYRGYCELGDRRPDAAGDAPTNGDGASDSGGDDIAADTGEADSTVDGCGNNTIDAGEVCDGTALGAFPTCAAAGWSGGSIGCMATCQLHDLSGCTGAPGNCNGVGAAGRQQCDGSELRGESCESLGFLGGSLSCTSDCAFDVSGCTPP